MLELALCSMVSLARAFRVVCVYVYTYVHTHIYCMCMGQLCLTMAMSYTTYRKCAKSKNTPESRQGHRLEGCSRGKERSLLPLLLPHSVNVNNKTQIKCIQRAPGNDYSNSSSWDKPSCKRQWDGWELSWVCLSSGHRQGLFCSYWDWECGSLGGDTRTAVAWAWPWY